MSDPIRLGADGLAVHAATETLYTAVALSLATGRPFGWKGFRAKGDFSGLSAAESEGIRVLAGLAPGTIVTGGAGAKEIAVDPGAVTVGPHRASLDASACLLPLLRAAALPLARCAPGAELRLVGSTHGPGGDTFEVLDDTWCYLPRRLGVELSLDLDCAGFVPRGGGEIALALGENGEARWRGMDLGVREPLESVRIVSAGARVPEHVQQRQAARARSNVHIAGFEPNVQLVKLRARSAGSVVSVTGRFGDLHACFASVSARGKSSESVGEEAATAFRRYAGQPGLVPESVAGSWIAFLGLAEGDSVLTVAKYSRSVLAHARLVAAFASREVAIDGNEGEPAVVRMAR